ncbi:MAG: hypothetical protein V1944_01805 [Candidatus Aenigmatarchaeota archaeon]
MEKNEIVKIFLDKGYMIDNESLDFFTKNQAMVQPFLDYYSDMKDKTGSISIGLVLDLLKIKPTWLQILKTAKKKQKFSVSDQTSFLNRRYEIIKKIMDGRLDLINLVSISKISQMSKKFSILGIVKAKNEDTKSLVLEDTTGEVEIYFSDNFLSEYESILHDDILGVICMNESGRYYYTKTVLPDVPIAREVKKTKESRKCVFMSISSDNNFPPLIDWLKKTLDDKSTIFIFSSGESPVKKLASSLPSVEVFHVNGTALVSLSEMVFFLSNDSVFKKYQDFFRTTSEGTLVSLIKRRNMNPSMDFDKSVYEEDPFILEEIPDIISVSSFEDQSITNYKGTNVLSLKDFSSTNSFLLLDTKTREVIKIEIS